MRHYMTGPYCLDKVWLQSSLQSGLNMIAISVLKRTIYHIWYINSRTIFNNAIIFGPFLKGLQPYTVRFGIEIVIIFSPFPDQQCNHIWSIFVPMKYRRKTWRFSHSREITSSIIHCMNHTVWYTVFLNSNTMF